jgi:ribosomal protein S18 acetylase RimI-like enzyme
MDSFIRPMRADDAPYVAKLHQEGIPTGFLSSLGVNFLTDLYTAIPSCASGFGYVCDVAGPVGFVAGAYDVGTLYKEVLRKRGVRMAMRLVAHAIRPSVIKNVWETIRYSEDVGDELPSPEILSIAVAKPFQRRGVGGALMRRALAMFRGQGIDRIKVAVWSANESAQSLYRRCGFQLAKTRIHHGLPMTIYTWASAAPLQKIAAPLA